MQMCKKTKFVQAISDLVLFPGQLWLKSPNVLISIETDFILQDLQYFSQPQSKKTIRGKDRQSLCQTSLDFSNSHLKVKNNEIGINADR